MKKQPFRKQFVVSAFLGVAVLSGGVTGCKQKEPQAAREKQAIPSRSQTMRVPEPAEKNVAVSDQGVEPIRAHPFALEHAQPCRVNHDRRARELRELGELEEALTEMRRAAFETPEDLPTLAFIADLARRTRDFSMAAVVYGELARLQPEDAAPLVQQARMLLALKDTEGALELVNGALMRDSEHPEAYHVRGRALLDAGRLAGAIEAFEETVARQPDHGYAYNNLGLAYLRSNQNEEALEVLTLAADYLPDVAFVQNNYGVALERTGRKAEAVLAFDRAVSLSPRYVKARVNAQRMAQVASISGLLPGEASEASGENVPLTESGEASVGSETPEMEPGPGSSLEPSVQVVTP